MNGTMNTLSLESMASLLSEEDVKDNLQEGVDLLKSLNEEGEETTKEIEEEEIKEQIVEDVTEDIVEDVVVTKSILAETALTLLEGGTWKDFGITYEDVEYDNLEDFISKVEVDAELFKILTEKQKEYEVADLEEKSVRIDNLDETEAKIIKAIASGLDAEKLLKVNKDLIEPLKKTDLTDNVEAQKIIYNDYINLGYDSEYAIYQVDKLTKNGLLTSTAEEVRDKYISEFEILMEEQQKELEIIEKEKTEKEKEDKKLFKSKLKENEYSDTFSKKAVDLMHGKTNGVEDWFLQVKSKIEEDPNFKINLAHFLLDTDDFIQKVTADKRRNEKLNTLTRMEITKASTKSKDGGLAPKKEVEDKLFSSDVVFRPLNK